MCPYPRELIHGGLGAILVDVHEDAAGQLGMSLG